MFDKKHFKIYRDVEYPNHDGLFESLAKE